MGNIVTQGVSNYLVPATGTPNAYLVREAFTSDPKTVNFNEVQLNGLAFRPSGVLIDNTAGIGNLVVLIPEMSYAITCAPGNTLNMPYPSPINHTASITGDGDATVIFVDYPIMPYSSAQANGASVPNPLPVTGPITDAELRASPVVTQISAPSGALTVDFFKETTPFTYNNLYSIKIENTGASDGTVGGTNLKPGEIFELNAIPYLIDTVSGDATGTEFTITQSY